MNTNTAIKSVALYFSEGSSDKEYHASIEKKDGGYVVNFAYGKRGSSLTTGSKTPAPVDLGKATKIYDKLVAEKVAKGYTTQEGGVAFSGTESAGRVSGLVPQLLNPVEESEIERLILNPAFCMQEKFDGERRMARGDQGVNRKGLFRALPVTLAESIRSATVGENVLDGEQIGETLHVFDILERMGVDLRPLPYRKRLEILRDAVRSNDRVRLVETAYTPEEKRALLAKVKDANGEGVVFKRLDAAYSAGRPNAGGPQLKAKFVTTASVKIIGQNEAKRSVRMAVLKGAMWIEVGSVTIPPNFTVPAAGAIAEVRYLYAYRDGALFQPVYLGERSDIDETECVESQLKYKAENAA